ncbi:MAG: sigma-70 family RNA polymerase sigma factor [Acidobacteriota bacterium]
MEPPRNPGPGPLDDVALVQRIADRRQEALNQLYDRYAAMILALATRILGDQAEAEDILQETMLQAWNQARHYDPRRSAPSTWLVLIARSRAIDRLRSRRVKQRTAVAAHAENPGAHTSPRGVEDVLFKERRVRVRRELEGLPAEQRSVLEMAFFEGLTQSEIAGKTGIPLGTVKTRTLLAMKKLRVALRDEIRELL